MLLDFPTVLQEGLGAYRRRIDTCRREERAEFYEAMIWQLEAIQLFIRRYAAAAEEAAARPGWDRERFLQAAADLERIASAPPATFRQALQLIWMLHMLNGSDSLGRFDQYVYPFYRRDLDRGVLSASAARCLLADFFVKVEEACQIQNLTLGGVTPDGRPAYNALTVEILDTVRLLGYKGPNLSLRVTENMPEEVWRAAMECLASGLGLPALYNDRVYVASLREHGIPPEEANDYALAGCSQVMIPGKSNFYNDVGLFNAAKILEIALYGGQDPRTGQPVGLPLGNAADFPDFDSLYAMVKEQFAYFCGLEARLNNLEARYRASREGYAMRTLLIRDCMEKGQTIFEGGARYNHIQLEIIGLTNAADSLYALKRAVYDDHIVTMDRLIEAMRHNFEGEENLRRRLEAYPKFGNDNPAVDALRADLSALLYAALNREPAAFGGVMVPGEVIFTAHELAGQVTGATPDGRLAGTVLADSAGARQGMDRSGPTALLNSLLKIPVQGYLLTSVVGNLKFSPSLFAEHTREIQSLFQAYFSQGGMQLQVNVVDAVILRDAMEHPEEHRSLVVRVGGYSDYFVNLSPALQQEILARTSQSM